MVRRTLRTVLLLALALAPLGAARASWGSTWVQGTPRDVEVWAPGVFSVAASGEACLFEPTGYLCIIDNSGDTGGFLGTFYDPTTRCFYALQRDGDRFFTSVTGGSCPTPGSVFGTGSTVTLRMKSTSAGSGFAVRTNLGVGGELTYSSTGMTRISTWQSLPESAASAFAFSMTCSAWRRSVRGAIPPSSRALVSFTLFSALVTVSSAMRRRLLSAA